MGSVANVLVGNGSLYFSEVGGEIPTLTTPGPLVWDPEVWTPAGYTSQGVEFSYTPTIKDITVDEEFAPIKKLLSAEKLEIISTLAEATLKNVQRAISNAKLSTVAPTLTEPGYTKLSFGASTIGEPAAIQLGFEGKSPQGFPRLIIVWKAISAAAVKSSYKKATETLVPVTFEALADSTQAAGEHLAQIIDVTAPHS